MHVSHWNNCTFKCIVCVIGKPCISRIVGLIQIHVASLESVWLSMLHNRVSILKWHLFILFIPLLRVIDPVYIWWNYFQWDYVTNLYQYHLLSMLITRGTQVFLLVELFEVDRRNGRGHLYFGVTIILIKHHVNQQWVQTGWLVPSSAELTTIFPSITVLLVFGQKNENIRTGVIHLPIGPNTCQLATVTVGRPSRVNVQETDNSICPWSCRSVSH